LLVMLHFIQKGRRLIQKIFQLSQHEALHFPLMSTSMNFTKLVLDLFRDGKLSSLKGDLMDALAEIQNAMLAYFAERIRCNQRDIHYFDETFKEVEQMAQIPSRLLEFFHIARTAADHPIVDTAIVNVTDLENIEQKPVQTGTSTDGKLMKYAV